MKMPEDIVSQIRTLLLLEPGIKLALLYGSCATGKMRPDSDVDIAVLFDRPLDAGRRMDLVARLGQNLARPVDLADLSSLNGTILRQILCEGRVLIKNDPAAWAALIKRMIYHQADLLPLLQRMLQERQKRFAYG